MWISLLELIRDTAGAHKRTPGNPANAVVQPELTLLFYTEGHHGFASGAAIISHAALASVLELLRVFQRDCSKKPRMVRIVDSSL